MKEKILFLGMLVSLLVINPVQAEAPFDYFLMIDGLPGESLDQRHRGWIDVIYFKEGIAMVSTAGSAGGVAVGRAQFADLTVIKRVDQASVRLKLFCTTGTHIKEVTLTCARKGTNPIEVYALKLTNVMVSGVKTSTESAGLLEEVTFSYAAIEWKYLPIGPDGRALGEIRGGFDLKQNRAR